jgi:hypothetical protein
VAIWSNSFPLPGEGIKLKTSLGLAPVVLIIGVGTDVVPRENTVLVIDAVVGAVVVVVGAAIIGMKILDCDKDDLQ